MALSTRLAIRSCASSQNGGMRWIHSTSSLPSLKSVTPQDHQMLKEEFWEKNKRLNRPISPHLTIYKPQMTSMLSITHRGTGLAWSGVLSIVGIGAIVSNTTFPAALATLQAMQIGAPIIFVVKFGLAWAVAYHTLNGLRHLAWDLGYGFKMPELYKTGYTVLGLSTVLALLFASL